MRGRRQRPLRRKAGTVTFTPEEAWQVADVLARLRGPRVEGVADEAEIRDIVRRLERLLWSPFAMSAEEIAEARRPASRKARRASSSLAPSESIMPRSSV